MTIIYYYTKRSINVHIYIFDILYDKNYYKVSKA